MTRVLGSVLFFIGVGLATALGIVTAFAVDVIGGGLRLSSHPSPPDLVAVIAGAVVAITSIAVIAIGVCQVSRVHMPTLRVHFEQSILLYLVSAAALVAYIPAEQAKSAETFASLAAIGLAAALVNGVVLYGIASIRRKRIGSAGQRSR